MWRTIVAFGALPAVFALYFRLTISETLRYTMDISFDVEKGKFDVDAYLSGKRGGTMEASHEAKLTICLVPGEVFTTRFRSTAHGILTGTEKVGAMIAQALVGPLQNQGGRGAWLDHVMEIFAAFMICGVVTTLLVPETKRRSLEELAEEFHGSAQ
ncbi:Inorganic phosphate transporter PHO84 [Tolypocladium ophioglossoides CBS 100239]|uniref:Inorganic phosphate transporter PHO84 n=1 Tax=Tolypocladium ophioglossoides (strain CBS 100239) TaxID=1163406 RepID=A0A0L0MYV0_TOLOC|nr:Inorganic phosphate transporter PHO84 [Tolypocladium ophioglossoides CBS 100239]